MVKHKNKFLLLLTIVLLAFLLRTINISQNPPALNWDEISHTYNAYSILKTGKDQWGTVLPSIFRVYGDYKLPLYIYLTVPFTALLGLTPLSTRLTSILAGTLLTLTAFKITQQLLKHEKGKLKTYFPYITAFSIALSSWSVFLSRIAVEANLFLLFFTISLYFLIKTPQSLKNLSTSALFYALSLHTYNSSRVLLPIYLLLLFLAYKKSKKGNKNSANGSPLPKLIGPTLLLLSISLCGWQTFFSSTGSARYQWVTLLDQGAINRINESRGASTLSPILARLVHNKGTYFTKTTIKNHLSHFNPTYLFKTGGDHYQFSLPNFWLINPLLAPFFLIGLLCLFHNLSRKTTRRWSHLALLVFLLSSPLPSAITRDAPHTLRSIAFLPLIEIASVFGLYKATYFFKKKNSKILFALPATITLSIIITQLAFQKMYGVYAKNYAWAWQYGYKETVEFTKQNYDQYDQIWFTKKYGEPHEFILFYWPWDPASYQNDPKKIWDYHASWYWVDAFDKFRFINNWEIREKLKEKNPQNTLLITTPGNYTGGKLLKTIRAPSQEPIFQFVKYP